ncbi:histidine triad nucleotide-binding protein [Asaia prunellae]|uniref:histidine triad nucleotide-binding protein n=1 Tax=Asaia prunellae TaxID=610245 RepID=UPI000470213D|nr:histidine triad nucleotide-binding protein [Asaia prunellae]
MSVDLKRPYDPENIFAKILRREVPVQIIYEDEYTLAFPDIAPQAPVHVLIIPKGPYVSSADFGAVAKDAEIAGLARAITKVAEQLKLSGSGYRLISNTGPDAGQEVPHYHVHLLAGEKLSSKLVKKTSN